jgi:nitrate reductase assembly molybdenum cofactor insertion protein NarJ
VKARRGDSIRVVRQAAAVCLGYPEPDVIATTELLRTALAEEASRQAESFEPLLAFWDSEELSTIQTHYVDVFDRSVPLCLSSSRLFRRRVVVGESGK